MSNILQLIANVLKMWNCKFCKLSFFIRIKEKYEILNFVNKLFFECKNYFKLKLKMNTKKKKLYYQLWLPLSYHHENSTKRKWARQWLKERFNAGIYQNLSQELCLQDEEHFSPLTSYEYRCVWGKKKEFLLKIYFATLTP